MTQASDIYCVFCRIVIFFCGLSLVTSCDNRDNFQQEPKGIYGRHGKVLDQTNASCGKKEACFGAAVSEVEEKSIEEMFACLVAATNLTVDASFATMGRISRRILTRKNKQDTFRLFDRLLELAIQQKLSAENDYRVRYNWTAKLWHISMCAFLGAQREIGNDFTYWDKIFKFYANCTDEIKAIESALGKEKVKLKNNSTFDGMNERRYVDLLKGELKTWVRIMKKGYFLRHSQNYTDEQKADILRRFDEVERWTEKKGGAFFYE